MVEGRVDGLRDRLESLTDPAGVLTSLLEHIPTALALYDDAGHCVRVNQAYCDLFGNVPDPHLELAEDHVLGRSGVLFWLRRAFSGETITTPTFWYEHEVPPARPARRRIALSARAFALRDRKGALEFVAVTFRDETDTLLLAERRRQEVEEPIRLIDEIQRAELERRTNEEQLRAVFEQCADGVMITDDDGRVVDINPSGCEIFGRRRGEIIGTRFWEHIGDVAESRGLSEKLLADGRLVAEVQVWRGDRELRDLELRSVANFLPHRHLTSFLDVTERKAALRLLRRSEAHLIASQRIAHVGSWELEIAGALEDLPSHVLRASDECFRIFGIEPGTMELTPAMAHSFVHPDDRASLLSALRRAIATQTVYSSEHRIRRPDGSERVVHARAEMVIDPATGRLVRLVGTTQDVTDRTHAQAEIRALNAELEQRVALRTAELEAVNRDLEAFTYSVSHDLRAPLRAINGHARILLDEQSGSLPDDALQSLRRIGATARRMDELIDGLLALSRLGRHALEWEDVDSRRTVHEAIEELALEPRSDRLEIVLGDLPACRADGSLLRQVFVNLVANAVKFSRDREPARIEIESRDHGRARVFTVRDNGIGFPMEHASRIFGVFERLPSANAFEGTGLGLAIVERIVRRHGGKIWVESSPGAGAAFHFTLTTND